MLRRLFMSTIYQNKVISIIQAITPMVFDNEESNDKNFTKELSELCLTHQNNKKWILVIDDEKHTLSELSSQKIIDTSKILHINNRKVKVNANNIETALTKGNCSAIVLGRNNFQAEQLSYLSDCAKLSNTAFVVLDKVSGLH